MGEFKIIKNYELDGIECSKLSCIYRFDIGDHFYIGSAKLLERRWKEHINHLKKDKHYSKFAQNAFNKHKCIVFTVIEVCNENNIYEREQYWIDTLNPDLNSITVVESRWKLSEEAISKRTEKLNKSINQYDLEGNFIQGWNSIKEAGETLGIGRPTISNCLKGILKSAGGFIWAYSEEDFNNKKEKVLNKKSNGGKSIPILQYDLEGNFIREWSGMREAKRELGIKGNITQCLKGTRKTASGFIWKYKNNIDI